MRYNYSVSSGSYNTVRTQAGAGGPITDKLRYRVDFGTKTQNGSLTLHYTPNASDRLELSIGGNNVTCMIRTQVFRFWRTEAQALPPNCRRW